jgi:hypothetical protein
MSREICNSIPRDSIYRRQQKFALRTVSSATLCCKRHFDSSFPFPILANKLFPCPELPHMTVSCYAADVWSEMSQGHLDCKSVGFGVIENEITHISVQTEFSIL